MDRMSRRKFIGTSGAVAGGLAVGGVLASSGPVAGATAHRPTTPAEALKLLLAGNARYANGKPKAPRRGAATRQETLNGQYPYAVILSCSDSRVPPEVLFDVGIGDIFVIRVAGNTATVDVNQGSIAYGLGALGARLLMVLGHQNCGACVAALTAVQSGPITEEERSIGQLGPDDSTQLFKDLINSFVLPIQPAAQEALKHPATFPAQLELVVQQNVRNQVALLKTLTPKLNPPVPSSVEVVGYEYSLQTGRVRAVS